MSGGRVDLAPIIGARVKPAARARHHGGRADLAPIPPVQSPRRPRVWSVTRVRGASSSNAGWCQSPRMGGVRMHEVDAEATGAGGGECVTWDTTELHPHVEIGQLVEKYGFRFTWTALHRTGSELAPYRQIGDDLADTLLSSVRISPGEDGLAVIRSAAADVGHPAHDAAKALLADVTLSPEWLDRAAVARGQQAFVRYGFGSLSMLFFFSLVGGFGAPRINKVLTSTGYLNNKHTFRRLFETTQMVTDCLAPGALDVGGIGWKSCIRVRLLHAKVRQRLRRLKSWDADRWGVPINQEDLCATQLSFCFNVLLGLRHMGVPVTRQECEDYTHTWRYMGHLLGVIPEMNPCTSFFNSQALMESIFMHLVKPDETSIRLAHNALQSISGKPPAFLPFGANAQMSRMMLGDNMADLLQLPPNNLCYLIMHRLGFFVFVRCRALLTRLPVIGPALMAASLSSMRRFVELGLGGHRTSFLMSHEPKSVKTGLEGPVVSTTDHIGPPMTRELKIAVWLRRIAMWLVGVLVAARFGLGAWKWVFSLWSFRRFRRRVLMG